MSVDSEIALVELLDHPDFMDTLVDWIQREWPQKGEKRTEIEHRLCGEKHPGKLPTALVAVAGKCPVGFVWLIHYEKGENEGKPHWINALYLEPAYRGRGLAVELITAAEAKAGEWGLTKLFALTDVPGIYEKAGWQKVDAGTDTSNDVVVSKIIPQLP